MGLRIRREIKYIIYVKYLKIISLPAELFAVRISGLINV